MSQTFQPGGQEAVFVGCFMFVYIAFILAILTLTVIAYWKICSKAGYPGALGLLILVPLANLVLILYLAFADWPILQRMRQYQQPQNTAPGQLPRENFRGL